MFQKNSKVWIRGLTSDVRMWVSLLLTLGLCQISQQGLTHLLAKKFVGAKLFKKMKALNQCEVKCSVATIGNGLRFSKRTQKQDILKFKQDHKKDFYAPFQGMKQDFKLTMYMVKLWA